MRRLRGLPGEKRLHARRRGRTSGPGQRGVESVSFPSAGKLAQRNGRLVAETTQSGSGNGLWAFETQRGLPPLFASRPGKSALGIHMAGAQIQPDSVGRTAENAGNGLESVRTGRETAKRRRKSIRQNPESGFGAVFDRLRRSKTEFFAISRFLKKVFWAAGSL